MKIQNSCAIVKLIAQIKTKEGESAPIKLSNFKIRSRIIDLKHHRSRKVLRLVRFNLSEIKNFPSRSCVITNYSHISRSIRERIPLELVHITYNLARRVA